MKHASRLIVFALAIALAFTASCRRGGEQPPETAPRTGTPDTVPPIGPAPTPPDVKPGDIAGKARVTFGFYLEKGPLTPKVTWDKSDQRLTISVVDSSVNIGTGGNTRIASDKATTASVRRLLADCVKRTVEQLPEVKVLEAHILFEDEDVGRVTATRREMEKAIAAADDAVGKVRGAQWVETMIGNLPKAWISPKLD